MVLRGHLIGVDDRMTTPLDGRETVHLGVGDAPTRCPDGQLTAGHNLKSMEGNLWILPLSGGRNLAARLSTRQLFFE
ncbi:hypothetical protein ACIBJE_17770 [Micromonospora sp. NPDC050187]|uniref:hypothetical protein n=1 Tax=Micromonospora sp. NPDC050187 TaxID=3364277 RepID=UPI00379742BD